MYKRVLDLASHTIGGGFGDGPHSSESADLSGMKAGYQQDVRRVPYDVDSTRNVSKRSLRGRVGGARKSQGTRTKSSVIRLAKCRKSSHVPAGLSCVSSYDSMSTLSEDEVTSECMWWYRAGR